MAWDELDRSVRARPPDLAVDPAAGRPGGRRAGPAGRAGPHPAGAVPVGPRADPRVAGPPPARGVLRGAGGHRRGGRGRRGIVGRAAGGRTPVAEEQAVAHLEEELGDLLFQVYFHATLAAEAGRFTLADVARGVHDKLVSRHPHVFGDVTADTPEALATNWEALKLAEKGPHQRHRGDPRRAPGAGSGGQAAAQGAGRGHGAARRGRRGCPTGRRGRADWPPTGTDRAGPADAAPTGRGRRRGGRGSATSRSRWPTWPGCSGSTPRPLCGRRAVRFRAEVEARG